MTDDIKILKEALAKGPTPGTRSVEPLKWPRRKHDTYKLMSSVDDGWLGEMFLPVDADFWAACSPDRISRLIERIEGYEKAFRDIAAKCGIPDAREACRQILKITKLAQIDYALAQLDGKELRNKDNI